MAITALVLGIVAVPGICCYGIGGVAFGVTALILGRVAIRRIRAANGALGGYGLAQAGWIVGLIAAVIGVLYGLFQLGLILLAATGTLNNIPSFFTPTPSGG